MHFFSPPDDEPNQEVESLLAIKKLSEIGERKLATACLKDPYACIERKLFEKIAVNLIMDDTEPFVRKLFRQASTKEVPLWLRKPSGELMEEAIADVALNPHIKTGPDADSDLALDILKSDEKYFISKLSSLKNFESNTCYGPKRYPLASMLILALRSDAVLLVLYHKNFDRNKRDIFNRRPAYYLLSNCPSSGEQDLFLALMGENFESWSMHYLGLYEKVNFDCLFNKIITDNKNRIIVFKKLIEQLCFWSQDTDDFDFEKISTVIRNTFMDSNLSCYRIYINKEFSQGALELLMHLGVIQSLLTQDDSKAEDFWSAATHSDLDKYNINQLSNSWSKHLIIDSNKCPSCQNCAIDLLKSGLSCEHGYCSDCWIDYLNMQKLDKAMCCPYQTCQSFLAPSLFIALDAGLVDPEKHQTLQRAHERCLALQQGERESRLKAVPGLVQCPSCNIKIVLNLETTKLRVLACKGCSNKFLVDGLATGGLLPLSLFANLSQCLNCWAIIDKNSNNADIKCPACKLNTTWIDIKN